MLCVKAHLVYLLENFQKEGTTPTDRCVVEVQDLTGTATIRGAYPRSSLLATTHPTLQEGNAIANPANPSLRGGLVFHPRDSANNAFLTVILHC